MVENLLYSIIPVICLIAGFYFGYKVRGSSSEDKLPDVELKSPATIIKEKKQKKQEEKELKEVKEWIEQIDNYNGEFGK